MNWFCLITQSVRLIEICVFPVTVEVKGPYEYLTLEDYPLMIVSQHVSLTLAVN